MTLNLELVKDGAESFVLRLLPQDRARLAAFDDKLQMMPMFTSNRDDLVRYLHTEVQFGNGTRLWDAVDLAITALSKETARKVILLLTDGDDTASGRGRDDVLHRAQVDDIMIYGIGLHSRYRGGPGGSWTESRPDRGLRKVADETGGGYFELLRTADLNSTFTRVADELHRQYVLGFSPELLDNKLHKLDVRVKVPGMIARARKSYLASKDSAPGRRRRRSRGELTCGASGASRWFSRPPPGSDSARNNRRRSSSRARRPSRSTSRSSTTATTSSPTSAKTTSQIFDNGRPQPITLFDSSVQPISIVIMLDTSGSMVGNIRAVAHERRADVHAAPARRSGAPRLFRESDLAQPEVHEQSERADPLAVERAGGGRPDAAVGRSKRRDDDAVALRRPPRRPCSERWKGHGDAAGLRTARTTAGDLPGRGLARAVGGLHGLFHRPREQGRGLRKHGARCTERISAARSARTSRIRD